MVVTKILTTKYKNTAGRVPEATRNVGTSATKPQLQSKPLSFVLKQLFVTSPALLKIFDKQFTLDNEKDLSIDFIETC